MTNSTVLKCISGVVCLVFSIAHMAGAIPVLKSSPGIEIMPAEFSPDGNLNFVVVDGNKDTNTNNQQQPVAPTVYQPPVQPQYVQPQMQQPQIQYQQPVAQQPQIQYQQPVAQQPQYQSYYPTTYQQQPQYVQPVQYPAPATYYSEPSGYTQYQPTQSRPNYSDVGPIGERGGFLSSLTGPSSSRYPSLGSIGSSLPTSLSAGASLLGAALLLG